MVVSGSTPEELDHWRPWLHIYCTVYLDIHVIIRKSECKERSVQEGLHGSMNCFLLLCFASLCLLVVSQTQCCRGSSACTILTRWHNPPEANLHASWDSSSISRDKQKEATQKHLAWILKDKKWKRKTELAPRRPLCSRFQLRQDASFNYELCSSGSSKHLTSSAHISKPSAVFLVWIFRVKLLQFHEKLLYLQQRVRISVPEQQWEDGEAALIMMDEIPSSVVVPCLTKSLAVMRGT